MFWLITVLLFLLAAAFVLVPLWRGSAAAPAQAGDERARANVLLFQERKTDLETELAAGNLDQDQFDALLLELQQNLLADVDSRQPGAGAPQAARPAAATKARTGQTAVPSWRGARIVPLLLVLAMPAPAYLLYERWGYIADVELMGLFRRTVDNQSDPEEAQRLIVSLGQVVQADPERPWAWYFLAENFAAIGMFNEAEIGYERAAGLLAETPEKALVLGRVAMAKYINAELQLTEEVMAVIEQARAINPSELTILQLLASDAAERQDYRAAIDYWRLLIQANPNSEQARALRANIAAAQQLLGAGSDAAEGPSIDVNLRLADGLDLAGNLRVFIAARNAAREGMPPLAAIDLTVANLPATIRLDNSSAIGPFNLASADEVYVSALVSMAGMATPSPGDYRVVSESFAQDGGNAVIELVIADRVP